MIMTATEPLGSKIRRQRRRLGFTLDDLAGHSRISKPYLSLIENGRVANPPSDEKLRRLEDALSFPSMELVRQAHLQRTPADVRAMLRKLSAGLSGDLPAPAEPGASLPAGILNGTVNVLDRFASPEMGDKKAYAARLCDESMTPRYGKGDVVIFSPAAAARSGDDCLVRLSDGRLVFQRVFFEKAEDGDSVVRLQPRNEELRPVIISAAQIAATHRAVYKYQRVGEES
jgi:repressor LexA